MITAVGLALLLAAPQAKGAPAAALAEGVSVGAPITKGNLSVFPLSVRPAAGTAGAEPLTLDEASRAKVVRVEEAGAGGDVNALQVHNDGDRPVLLMAGELLLGGKQDRIVGRSLVLPPRSRQPVPVYCVEHGRWSGGRAFESGGALVPPGLRKTALAGDQQQVWDEVARSNRKLGTQTSSGTYRAAARKLSGEAGPVARELSEALARDPQAAGLAVAIDGEVVAVEWFASPRLFGRVREKLVASYVAQALADDAPRPASAPAPAAPKDVIDFARKAEQGAATVERATSAGEAVQTTYLK
ncbi:MAG: hypothetical protein QM704_23540 [Anaeromyxobacteraceae bacterium]